MTVVSGECHAMPIGWWSPASNAALHPLLAHSRASLRGTFGCAQRAVDKHGLGELLWWHVEDLPRLAELEEKKSPRVGTNKRWLQCPTLKR